MRKFLFTTLSLFGLLGLITACNSGNSPQEKAKEVPTETASSPFVELEKQLAEHPESDSLYRQRAVLYLALQQINKALNDINQALQINGKSPDNLVVLSDIYRAMGEMEKSEETLLKTVLITEEHPGLFLRLAKVNLIKGEHARAKGYIDRSLMLDGTNPEAYFVKGYVYLDRGDTAKAIGFFQESVAQADFFGEGVLELAQIFAAQHNPLAIDYYKNYIKASPSNLQARYNLGIFQQEHGEQDAAMTTYSEMTELAPDFLPAYYNMGYIQMVYKADYQSAIAYFSRALEIEPDHIDALYNRAYAYELAQEWTLAREGYQQVLKKQSNHPKAIQGLNRMDNNLRP